MLMRSMPAAVPTWHRKRTQIGLIGVALGHGARDHRCARGPLFLRHKGMDAMLRARGIAAGWQQMLMAGEEISPLAAVTAITRQLAAIVTSDIAAGKGIAVIGGDHSCAVGTWSGAARALRSMGPLGLIWLDAHMDSHTPATSPSGMLHGMPLAMLLGKGPLCLTALARPAPALLPQHVALLGVRSFEPEEKRLLAALGVRVFSMGEIRRRGLESVLAEAAAIASGGTSGFGLSIDLDVVDPQDAPGTGSPVVGGLRRDELLAALSMLAGAPRLLGVEIAEFNPVLDIADRTARLIIDMLAVLLPRSR